MRYIDTCKMLKQADYIDLPSDNAIDYLDWQVTPTGREKKWDYEKGLYHNINRILHDVSEGLPDDDIGYSEWGVGQESEPGVKAKDILLTPQTMQPMTWYEWRHACKDAIARQDQEEVNKLLNIFNPIYVKTTGNDLKWNTIEKWVGSTEKRNWVKDLVAKAYPDGAPAGVIKAMQKHVTKRGTYPASSDDYI